MKKLRIRPQAVAFLKRRLAEVFDGEPTGSMIASNIAFGAAVAGSGHIEMVKHEGWWILASEHNWLRGKAEGADLGEGEVPASQPRHDKVAELFERIVPFPQQGPTSHRAEIQVTAFAEQAYYSIDGAVTWVIGKATGAVHEGVAPPWCGTVLAFRTGA